MRRETETHERTGPVLKRMKRKGRALRSKGMVIVAAVAFLAGSRVAL